MSRRAAAEERRLDSAVNEERERVRREAKEQILQEEDAKAILEKTRDWQEDMEEKQYESYMRNFAVQTGQQVNDEVRSKEDETADKKKVAAQQTGNAKPNKQLADIEKVVSDHTADKVAEKVVEKAQPKEEEKPAPKANADAEKAPEAAKAKDVKAAAKPAASEAEKKVPTATPLGKSAKLQTAVADLHETSEPEEEKKRPKSMDQEDEDEDEASDSKKPAKNSGKEADDSVGKQMKLTSL